MGIQETEGLVCHKCGCKHFFTLDTRKSEMSFRGTKKGIIRRRKICRHCKTIRHTVEIDEETLEAAGEAVLPRNDARWPRGTSSKEEPAPQPPLDDLPPNPYLS